MPVATGATHRFAQHLQLRLVYLEPAKGGLAQRLVRAGREGIADGRELLESLAQGLSDAAVAVGRVVVYRRAKEDWQPIGSDTLTFSGDFSHGNRLVFGENAGAPSGENQPRAHPPRHPRPSTHDLPPSVPAT